MTTRAATRAIRLRMLEDALEQAPRSASKLAGLFGVGRRTIQRDLEVLEDLGHTLKRRGRRYHLVPRSTALNPVEALAVHSVTRLLVHHTRVNEGHYRSALTKLSRQLPQPARRFLEASLDDIETLSTEGSRMLELIAHAWFSGRVLRRQYNAPIGSAAPHRPQSLLLRDQPDEPRALRHRVRAQLLQVGADLPSRPDVGCTRARRALRDPRRLRAS